MIGPESDHWLPFSLTKLEVGPAAKLDEFLEKFQMVFDPPPPYLLENYIAIFCNGHGCIYGRRHEGKIVRNACT